MSANLFFFKTIYQKNYTKFLKNYLIKKLYKIFKSKFIFLKNYLTKKLYKIFKSKFIFLSANLYF
jgi:hypothetical protein